MLNPSDVYVSGGSNNLLACWTDKVTKYDASSFYNWEQDNLPLHDLDERTHLLWEKLGHPTSALTGMSFIVSADATSSCNPLYFTTLSACIDALPEVINYPILVEVASFGNLGGLNLSNKSFGPNGALEIINRNCAFQGGGTPNNDGYQTDILDSDASNGLVSALIPSFVTGNSLNSPGGFLATSVNRTLSAVPTIALDSLRARLFIKDENGNDIYISSSVGSEYLDTRFSNPYVFSKRNDRDFNRLTAALSSTLTPFNTSPTENIDLSSIVFEAFDKTPNTEMATYDVSTLDYIQNADIVWGSTGNYPPFALVPPFGTIPITETVKTAAGSVYFNNLDYIKVNNCDGPIYLRNFNVDAKHLRDNGIEIVNSRLVLERTAVSRANKAGLYSSNSDIALTRGFIGYRNYELINSQRTGTPFSTKRISYQTQDNYGAGIYALNSTINLSSTYERDLSENLKFVTTDLSSIYSDYLNNRLFSSIVIPKPTTEEIYCLSRNDIGIHSINSNIIGGNSELIDGVTSHTNGSQLTCELNTEAGMKLENSVLDYAGRVALDGNYFGLYSVNSTNSLNTIAARYNQSIGIKLVNSNLDYNKDLFLPAQGDNPANVESWKKSQIACIQNGQDIICDNSNVEPLYTSSMPSIYGMVYTSGCFGKADNSDKLLPSVYLTGGSNADFVHAHMVRDPGAGNTLTSQYGLLAHIEDQSTMTVRGSTSAANVFLGPATRNDSVNVAGIYVSNDSNFKVQGPTTIGRFGVDVLAEDNSNVEFTPHQDNNGSLLVSSFDLSNPANHTMVELHSTRSCLVANRNSNILMENLGDYQDKWINGAYASAITGPYDYANSDYSTYASAGYMQFYPNANSTDGAVISNPTNVASNNQYVFQSDGTDVTPYYLIHQIGNAITGISTGGMCVRAVENSLIQANNVHFPTTWHNTSGVIYDLEGTSPLPGDNCTRLFIWNIADNSMLKASYLTVSGLHPRDAGVEYQGPSGTWGVSAAPSSTPDTSSLSVLDYYGQATDNPFGKATAENFGPFRLYFSTDPAADFMVASGTNRLEGFARQVFAQGYNFSGNLIASSSDDFEASSQYLSVLQRNEAGNIHPSGFYYASAMVASPDTIKAVLDDSALNTFANAKHNTVGKSGLAKVVEGYYAVSAFGGDSYNDYAYGTGVASINNFDLKKDN